MDGHLVRLARRARGERVGFTPTATGPPPLPTVTDELQAQAPPAAWNSVTVDAPRALVPPPRDRPQPRFQRDTAPSLAPRVLEKGAPTLTLPRKGGRINPAASAPSISPAPMPSSVDGAPLTPTLMPGAPADSQPIGVSEITSEILGERPHPDPAHAGNPATLTTMAPRQAGEGDFRLGDEDPQPDPPRRTGKGDFRVAVRANTPMTPVSATSRVRSRSRDTFAEPVGNEPVRVTIGRIEVRAPAPATAPPPSAEPAMVPRLSLAEYLQQRDREDGR